MKLEKAKEILSEIVITESCIESYNYISANEINQSIQVLLYEIEKKEEELRTFDLRKNKEIINYKREICRKDIIISNIIDKLNKYSGAYFYRKKLELMSRG